MPGIEQATIRSAEEVAADARPRFSVSARLRSIGYARDGLRLLARDEHNAWVHMAATLAVVVAGCTLGVDRSDWRWLLLAVALVWMAEAFNTAIERLCDRVNPNADPAIKAVKDLAAGAVLVVALAAALIGTLTLLPYLSRQATTSTLERTPR